MKKLFLLTCCAGMLVINASAQTKEAGIHFKTSFYSSAEDLKIDSLKRVVRKEELYGQSNGKEYLRYVKNCVSIGLYYERLYEQHELPDMKKALLYYKKIANEEVLPGEPEYFAGAAIKTTLYRKLADIYFKGKGVKKDIILSRRFALKGTGNNAGLVHFYSMRYYGRENVLAADDKLNNYLSGNDFLYKFNPFAAKSYIFTVNAMKKRLAKIVAAYRLRNINGRYTMEITSYCEATMSSQARCNKLMYALKNYLIEYGNLPDENINTNCEVDDGSGTGIIEIKFIP